MEEREFKIIMKMGWEFVVTARSQEEALEKTAKFIKNLFSQDGYSHWASEAEQDLLKSRYSINEYTVFLVR